MDLKRLRLEKKWSMERLAEEADISIQTVRTAERMKPEPTHTIKKKLAKALEITVKELEES